LSSFPGYVPATCPNCERRHEIHRSLFADVGMCWRAYCDRCGNDFCVMKPEPEITIATESPRLSYTLPTINEGEKNG